MDEAIFLSLMADLHKDAARLGPGSDESTEQALRLTRLSCDARIDVADIGCGTGASSLTLARKLANARFVATDLLPEFLEVLATRARESGFAERIKTQQASMESLPQAGESLDLIWSEGAVYNIGFRAGLKAWKPLLRSGGLLAVSEITWLQPHPPEAIRQHWESEYSEIATATEKIAVLEEVGYDLQGYFVLPPSDWIENYYHPIEEEIPAFLARHADCPEAVQIAEMTRHEASLYERYQDWFSYGFYIARKR